MESVDDLLGIDINSLEVNELPDVCNDYVFVDLQGFRAPRRYICKEFCLIDKNYEFHAIVKSPVSFKSLNSYYQRQVNCLTRFFHGIKYDSGDVNIAEVVKTIYPKLMGKKVLVKGEDKVIWFNYIFRHCEDILCLNIENLGLDHSLHRIEPYDICEYHNKVYGWKEGPCALSAALKLKDILINNSDKIQ